jgi:hypothetical protein
MDLGNLSWLGWRSSEFRAIRGGFALPRRTSGDEGQTIYDPGFLGTVVISAAAAFLTWAYSTNASFSDQVVNVKPIAGAFLAGIKKDQECARGFRDKSGSGEGFQRDRKSVPGS